MRTWSSFACGALALLTAGPIEAQVLTVGADGACSASSIQAAVNAASDGATIRIARNATYSAQAVLVSNKDLTMAGGYETCATTSPSGFTTLSGQGGASDSVITIRGASSVTLTDLVVTRGDEVSDGYGGGVDYKGTGALVLDNVGIAQNYAGYGGGVSVISEGGVVAVAILTGTVVQLNTAQYSGGGIRIEGSVRLEMIEPETTLFQNEARGINPANNQPLYGNGGGLQVIAPATADIGSPGYGNSGPIANNTARYGGGIAIDGAEGTDADARVRVFTTDPARPTRLNGNRATQTGGAAHLLPAFSDIIDLYISRPTLCIWDVRIEDNRAQNGAAIYGDTDFGTIASDAASILYVNRQDQAGDCNVRPTGLGAVPCAAPPCTVFERNLTVNALNQPTGGATILLQNTAYFRLRDLVLTRNEGGDLIRLFEPFYRDIEQLLATDNVLSGSVLHIEDGVDTYRLVDSTIANNTMAGAPVLSVAGDFALERSIIWQPGKTVLSHSGSLVVDDVIANEVVSLLGGPEATVAQPRFADPAHGDYTPIAASPAVDFASGTGTPLRDVLVATREVDLPARANVRGARDAGAIERQGVGNLVLNPDFPSRTDVLRLWTQPGGGANVTWNGSEGAPGDAGAVFVAYQPPIGSATSPEGGAPSWSGLRQCVLLPGPATYALSAWTRVPGTGANRDYARLHWVLRHASADCSGPPSAEGDHFLARSGTWSPSSPAEIPLAPGAWTPDSSVEVTMEVLDGDAVGTNLVDAYFDRIELRVGALEVDGVFANGFE